MPRRNSPHAGAVRAGARSWLGRDGAVAAAFLELELFGDAQPFLPRVTMPALVLHRRGDRAVPIARGRELAALLPNARFVAIDGGGHIPLTDHRVEVEGEVRTFLQSL